MAPVPRQGWGEKAPDALESDGSPQGTEEPPLPAWGSWSPRSPPTPLNKELGLPFQVIQKEEEGQQVGLWERQQQVKHAALFCNGV